MDRGRYLGDQTMRLLMGMVSVAAWFQAAGCTSESTRLSIETQRRVDDVQQTVVERQNEGLRILLFRDLLRRLRDGGVELGDGQMETLNAIWNERDLIEFWAVQNERALGLRRVGVDAKLYSEQSILDLAWKALSSSTKRLEQGMAAAAGAQVVAKPPEESPQFDRPSSAPARETQSDESAGVAPCTRTKRSGSGGSGR